MFGLTGRGAYAEQVIVPAAAVAKMPPELGFNEAAALPLVSLTAWQGMIADGRNLSGLKVLVHSGVGGGDQIASARRADVTATAAARNADSVRALGAAAVADFRTDDPAPSPT